MTIFHANSQGPDQTPHAVRLLSIRLVQQLTDLIAQNIENKYFNSDKDNCCARRGREYVLTILGLISFLARP